MVRVALTLLCRDAEELIEPSLDFHFRHGVDFVVATDNNSSDSTRSILSQRDGVQLIVEEGNDWDHSAWVTRMARLAADQGADWVLHADQDEFWCPTLGRFEDVLSVVPDRYGAIAAPRWDFVPRSPDGRPFYRRMTALDVGSPGRGARLWPKLAHRASAGATVGWGAHSVEGPGLEAVPGWSPLHVLHYPLHSYEQFEAKVIQAGRALERSDTLWYIQAWDQYRKWQRGELPAEWARREHGGAEVDRGVREGRLVLDGRVDRALSSDDPVPPATEAELDALRLELRRAVADASRPPTRRACAAARLDRVRRWLIGRLVIWRRLPSWWWAQRR